MSRYNWNWNVNWNYVVATRLNWHKSKLKLRLEMQLRGWNQLKPKLKLDPATGMSLMLLTIHSQKPAKPHSMLATLVMLDYSIGRETNNKNQARCVSWWYLDLFFKLPTMELTRVCAIRAHVIPNDSASHKHCHATSTASSATIFCER
jgi:hypothetical protein